MYIINVLVLTVLILFSSVDGYVVPVCLENGKKTISFCANLPKALQVTCALKELYLHSLDSHLTRSSV